MAACFISTPVLSLPVNPTVVNGAASFNQVGNVLTVTNSNGAIINWNKFSIQAGETTHFAQTSASSTVLNRVLNDPTAIYGTLSSNGRVWLVNPAGIMVGPGGKVDVAGFVASTLNISNADFLAGRSVFINDGSAGNVINQGEIRTPAGGSVYLIGSNVTNEGIIVTPKGETILAAGATVSLIDSATPGVKVDITGAEGNATNLGTITAEAGRIGIAGVIVRNSGQINASSVVSEGGRVFLKASQDAYVDGNGRIVTTGTKGGSVEVLGNRVAVTGNAEIDASGTNGGGRIMVGGDYQGANPDIQNASITYFGPDASLKANATEVGDGGTVIVWSDDTTRTYGSISARGGAAGGNGGLVETSGKRYLDTPGIRVDVGAPNGKGGTWLLDPSEINIVASGATTVTIYGGPPVEFSYGGNVGTLVDDDLNGALSYGGSVIVRTDGVGGGNGNITVTNALIDGNGTGTGSLTLAAYGGGSATGNITISGSTIMLDGAFKALAGWDGATTYDGSDTISGKGNITISASTIQSNQNIDLHAGKDITLGNTGTSGVGTWIQSDGIMSVSAQNLNLYGGSTAKFDISGAQGPGVMLRSNTDQDIEIDNQILLQAGSADNTAFYGSVIYGGSVAIVAGGEQDIFAKIIKVHAGQSGHDNSAEIQADGAQTITITGSGGLLEVKGGGDNNPGVYGGAGSFNNQARIQHGQYGGFGTGDQTITIEGGGAIAVYGGSGTGALGYYGSECASVTGDPELCRSSNNNAVIDNGVGSQLLAFTTNGSLTVTGGSGGDQNWAGIENNGDDQTITGNPNITLTGGTGGRLFVFDSNNVFDFVNDAGIYNEGSGGQFIYGGSITINGGGDATSYGGAGIGNEGTTGISYISATGNLTMNGGASSAYGGFYLPGEATAAFINTESANNSLTIDVAGNISLTGGSSYGGAVLVGTVDGGASTLVKMTALGTFTVASGANSAVLIGNVADDPLGGAEVILLAGGNMSVTGTANAPVMIGSLNGGTNPTSVMLGSMRNVTLSRANVGSWNGDAAAIAVYGGYMDDGFGVPMLSGYGGSLSFTRTRLGSSLGDADIALYAAYGGAGTGNISFTDGGGAYGASIDIVAERDLTLTASTKGVRLQSTTGTMSIKADNFAAYGGNVVRPAGDVNLIGEDVSYGGAQILVQAGTAGQTIDVANDLLLQSGTVSNSYGGNSSFYGGAVTIASAGTQTITAGGMTLQAGASGHDNTVHVKALGDQTINVYGGGLTLRGGGAAGSYNNDVGIFQDNPGSTQTINVYSGGSLAVYGGAGSGLASNRFTWSCDDGFGGNLCLGQVSWNGARIRQNGSGDQTINFDAGGALWLEGGSGGNLNRAMISAENGGDQIISGTAAITLKGGASGGTYYGGADAFLDNGAILFAADSAFSGGSQTINGSSLTMIGGASGGTTGAYIQSVAQDITISGSATLTGGSGAGFHNRAGIFAEGLTAQTIDIGGNLTLDAGDNAAGHKNDAGIWAYGGAQTLTVGGKLAAYGGTGGYDNAAFVGADTAATVQTINAGSIHLQAGGGTGPNAGYNNAAKIYYSSLAGDQFVNVTGITATVVLKAGTGTGIYGGAPDSCKDGGGATLPECANLSASNVASITSRGSNQTIAFSNVGGSLSLEGGSGGNNNQALIYLDSAGLQTIVGAPDIALKAGSGGVYIRDLDYLLGSHARIISKGTQSIDAGSLTMTGGTGGASRAVITAPGALAINVKGDVTLNGGGGTNTVQSYYGGVLEAGTLSLPGATGTFIGSDVDTTSLEIKAGKSIKATGYGGGVWLRTLSGGSVALRAGWDADGGEGGAPSGFGGDVTLSGPVFVQTPGASGNVDIIAYESSAGAYGSIDLGAGAGVYGTNVYIAGAGNIDVAGSLQASNKLVLDAGWNEETNAPSSRGGNLTLAGTSSVQAGYGYLYAEAGTSAPYGGGNILQNLGSNLVATNSDIELYADRNITLNGSVSASYGYVYARAGYSSTRQFGGNIEVRGTISGGYGVDLVAESASGSGLNGNINQYGSGSITSGEEVRIIGGGNVTLQGSVDGGEGGGYTAITVKAGFSEDSGAVTPYGGNILLAGTSDILGNGDVFLSAEAGAASGANGTITQNAGSNVIANNGGSIEIIGGGTVTLNGDVGASTAGGTALVRAGYSAYGAQASAYGGNLSIGGDLSADGNLVLSAFTGSGTGLNGNITQLTGSEIFTANGSDIEIYSGGSTTINGDVSSGYSIGIVAGLDPNAGTPTTYGGGIAFNAGSLVEARNGVEGDAITAATYGGSITQAASSQLIARDYGDIYILSYGDALMNGTTTISNAGGYSINVMAGLEYLGGIRPGSSNIVSINRFNAEGGDVIVQAGGAILRSASNPSGTNILADQVSLTSVYGGASNGLAISAITEATGSLMASVNAGAAYGGISLINLGDQPVDGISLTDNATNAGKGLNGGLASIAFFNAGDLALDGTTTFSSANSGDIAINSGGNLDYSSGITAGSGNVLLGANQGLTIAGSLAVTNNLSLSAGGAMNIDSAISGSNVTLTAPTININDASVGAVNDAILIGSTINIDTGGVSAANVLLRGPALGGGNLNMVNGGSVDASGQLEFNLANITASDGSFLLASSASSNITGFISGGITLTNGSYFESGDDINLSFSGGSSSIALSNGSYVVSDTQQPVAFTTFLNFLGRSSGGVLIDGRESTTASGGTGFFVFDTGTPATTGPGGGLVITYANSVVIDPCASSPDLCKPPTPVVEIIKAADADPCATAPDSAQCKAQKPDDDKDKEKDQFGDEQENGKKDEKSSQKKVAQCGI